MIGFTSGTIPDSPANLTLLKSASIVGVYWGDWAAREPGSHVANLREMAGMIAEGKLQPRVTASFDLNDYREAFQTIAERRVLGKIVFRL